MGFSDPFEDKSDCSVPANHSSHFAQLAVNKAHQWSLHSERGETLICPHAAGFISAATILWSSVHSPGKPGTPSAAGVLGDLLPKMSMAVSPVPAMSLSPQYVGTYWHQQILPVEWLWQCQGDQCPSPSPHLSL